MNYSPDTWVILKIEVPGQETLYKLLAGYYSNGPLGSDSWRTNSGITKIEEMEKAYIIKGVSGSSYVCPKQMEQFTGQTSRVLDNIKESAKALFVSVEVVPISTILKQYETNCLL